ncbi:hypothetical protein RUM44_007451 [Polyplax serrata]|uniref:m7GpppX diphosphatase n=1 Tax=Polyplax serrata TaxID=468196 RepID=A0ABR1B0Q2_POLSC
MAVNKNCGSLISHSEQQIDPVSNISNFEFKRILSDNKETKTVAIEGSFKGKPEPAVFILEKEPFHQENLGQLFREENIIEKTFSNDIYYQCQFSPTSVFNGIKLTFIYPATEKHITKYEHQVIHIIEETPELYQTVTLPFLKSEQFSLQWVFNILEHESEKERIVYEDSDPETGFILCSDIKWDGKSKDSLYLLALPFKRGIMSLRDLTQKDLPLLKNIRSKGIKAVQEKYNIPSTQLRIYVHYQPSFYHFHVHFTNLQHSPPGCGTDRAHLLSTVINNLELMNNYYQMSNLNFTIRENDKLFDRYESYGLVKRTATR